MDGKDDGDYEASAFEALERDFQEILQELVGDKSLEHFRQEYEKLHRALKKSHESEKSLIKKCRELNTEIVQNAVKVQTALKLSQEDQSTINALKKEIERAWKMVETSHEKEQRAKETIHNLKAEIAKLGRLVEQGAGLSINQENMVNQLVQEKNDLIKHRDMLQGQVGQLTQTNQDLGANVQRLEAERAAGGNALQELREQLEDMVQDAEKEQKRKEHLDKSLKELRNQLENRQNEINANREEKLRNEEHLAKVEAECKLEKQQIEALNVKHEQLEESRDALKKANAEEQQAAKKLSEDRLDIQAQLKNRRDEIAFTKKQKARLQFQLEALNTKKLQGDAEKKKLIESTQALKVDIAALVKELEGMKRQAELDGKAIVDLLHERDILNKKMVKADENRKQQRELVRRHESQADTLAKDLQRWKFELQVKLHRIHELDRQREKYATELESAKARFVDACDLLKARDDHAVQLKKNIADVKAKLSQQKNLYEAVRTDKNLYSKNLIESQEEISEMHKKFKTMNLQIEQLKEEIKEKDKVLMEVHFNSSKDSQLKEQLKKQLKDSRNRLSKLTGAVDTQQQDIKKLEATIQDAEAEQQNQRKEFEAVTSERNILSTQLIRRNEELALLFEKIKIQESTLHKGEIQYKNRLDEIKKQRESIANLKRDLHDARKQVENTDDLKKEVYHLQRDLLQERTKVKALSEELENPMNVHRWRKLEGSDPAMYELIQKVRTLQKRLISKTEQVLAKDVEIQEKERVHKDLMKLLEKQPGPEIMEQLELYQDQLGSKTKQMRAMQSELRTYQSQVGDYKDEIDRLTRELQEVKRKYFEQKKREQTLQDAQRGDTRAIHPRPVPMQRFTGGGFNLAH